MSAKKIMYAPACRGKSGFLGLMSERWLCSTREEAETILAAIKTNNSPQQLAAVFGGDALSSMRVDEFECWASGAPCGVYAKSEEGLLP